MLSILRLELAFVFWQPPLRVAFRQNLSLREQPIEEFRITLSALTDFLRALPDALLQHGVGGVLRIVRRVTQSCTSQRNSAAGCRFAAPRPGVVGISGLRDVYQLCAFAPMATIRRIL